MAALKLVAALLMVGLALGQKGCQKPCTTIYRPVCGSDGKTYGNRCALENKQCVDKELDFVHGGACGITPGFCPKPLVFGHCGFLCNKDSDCRKGEKCCSNGCGKGCMLACKQLRCRSCPKGTKAKTDSNNCPTCQCEDCKKVPFYCTEKCEHGYKVDRQGCTQCECKPKCPGGPRCTVYCPLGYMKDKKGCPTCRCRPRAPCPRVKCNSPCVIRRSLSGCPICVCKAQKKTCPPKEECPADCAYITTPSGCQKCNCSDDGCPKLSCTEKCDYGQKVDARGCLTCICLKPLACPPLTPCPRACSYKKDKYGCMKCKCSYACPYIDCKSKCQSGYRPDKNGCPTCTCKDLDLDCPRPFCMTGCRIVRGSNGCPTCKC